MKPPHTSGKTRLQGLALRVAPVVVYTLAIFYFGTIPLVSEGPSLPGMDKVVHALGFGVYAALTNWAVQYLWPALGRGQALVVAALVAILCGGGLEVAQSFAPPRTAELLDWVADAVGAGLFALTAGYRGDRRSAPTG